MQTTGWIKIHRRVLEWQWYTDVNVKICSKKSQTNSTTIPNN